MSAKNGPGENAMAILTDVTRCVGCEKCVMACERTWNTGDTIPSVHAAPDGLSGNRWTSIVKIKDRFVRKQCLHCVDPSCVGACPVHAFYKMENGAVIYKAGKCIGCRYCMLACPYSIPRYDWDEPKPFVQKCKLCYDRLLAGQRPACTTACPYGATIFGTRTEMIAEAHKRLTARHNGNEPVNYIDKIWGLQDYGGTSVMYLSDVNLYELGFPTPGKVSAPNDSIPGHYSHPVALQTPFLAATVFGSLAGITWIINRRMAVGEQKQKEKEKDY